MYLTWLQTYDLVTLKILIPSQYKSVQDTWDLKKFKHANIVEYAYLGYIKGHSRFNLIFMKYEIKFSRIRLTIHTF